MIFVSLTARGHRGQQCFRADLAGDSDGPPWWVCRLMSFDWITVVLVGVALLLAIWLWYPSG